MMGLLVIILVGTLRVTWDRYQTTEEGCEEVEGGHGAEICGKEWVKGGYRQEIPGYTPGMEIRVNGHGLEVYDKEVKVLQGHVWQYRKDIEWVGVEEDSRPVWGVKGSYLVKSLK